MEVNILGYQRSQEEVPGWLVPQLYFEYLQTKDPQPLVGVFYHNSIDIVSLAALFCTTNQMLDAPFEPLCIPSSNADYIGLARIFEKISMIETAARLYATGIENGLPDELEMPALLRYAELCKRNGYFDDAINLWSRAASQGNIDACIELAKYYEHQACDLQKAYTCTMKAISYLPEKHTYSLIKQEINLNARLTRLINKIDHSIEQRGPEDVA
jgi:tetratricopeptide (TPR) repeat protein